MRRFSLPVVKASLRLSPMQVERFLLPSTGKENFHEVASKEIGERDTSGDHSKTKNVEVKNHNGIATAEGGRHLHRSSRTNF